MTRKPAWQVIAPVLLYLGVNLVIAGLLTNWFRYAPSLEVLFVLVPQVAGLFVVGVVAIILHANRRTGFAMPVLSFAVAMAMVLWAMKESHGVYFPEWQWNDVIRNQEEHLSLKSGERLKYYLELRNPFAARAKVILVITDRRGAHRIRLPWNATMGAFVWPTERMQWGSLTEMHSHRDVLMLKTTIQPTQPRSFLIDLKREKARELR